MIPLYKVPISRFEKLSVFSALNPKRFNQETFLNGVEEKLIQLTGAKYAVTMSNGTLPLLFALQSINLDVGDEVIIPSFTFVATANVVSLLGATPVFVDIDPDTYSIDLNLLLDAVTEKTKAIIVVHEFGFPINLQFIRHELEILGVRIIEDAACALGSTIYGEPIAKESDMLTFSFHPRKIVSCGEGGALITNSPDIAEQARIYRNHGLLRSGGGVRLVSPSINARLSEFQAALLLPQLNRIAKIISRRKRIARIYLQALNRQLFSLPTNQEWSHSNWQSFMVVPKAKYDFDAFRTYMLEKDIGIASGAQFIPSLDFYADKYKVDSTNFPVGFRAGMYGFCLPIFPGLRVRQAKRVADVVNQYFSHLS